jgi:hypothetical protein
MEIPDNIPSRKAETGSPAKASKTNPAPSLTIEESGQFRLDYHRRKTLFRSLFPQSAPKGTKEYRRASSGPPENPDPPILCDFSYSSGRAAPHTLPTDSAMMTARVTGEERQHGDDDERTGSVYAGLTQLFRILRNARGAYLPHPLGAATTQGGYVAAVAYTPPSPSSPDGPRRSSATGQQNRR